ncbi:MAG: lasso peptide biosynthesis B2 protein [Pyrinomonadaceae bacterium]|nr:lasso peptide biosynthesis B2 protein [Pyrinomonadaceae bacterium]
MYRLKKFAELPKAEKTLSFKAFLIVGLVRTGLWLAPSRLVHKLIAALGNPNNELIYPKPDEIAAIVRWVRIAGKRIPRASCLTQAIAVLILFRLRRRFADLKFGVAKTGPADLEAHAWLEVNGKVILGKVPGHGRYFPLGEKG